MAVQSIFNDKASESLRSPEDLDKYVRVTNPSVWALLGACIALLAGLFAWGFFGAVSSSVSAMGVVQEKQVLCLLDSNDINEVAVGDVANVDGHQLSVASISAAPYSRSEVRTMLGNDYLVSALMSGDWAYVVTFEGDANGLATNVPLSVYIVTERVAPFSLIFGNK